MGCQRRLTNFGRGGMTVSGRSCGEEEKGGRGDAGRGDAEKERRGEGGMRGRGEGEKGRRGDAGMRGRGETGTRRRGTRGRGERSGLTEKRRIGVTETRSNGDRSIAASARHRVSASPRRSFSASLSVLADAGGELARVVIATASGGIAGTSARVRIWTTSLVAHLRGQAANAMLVE
jgi:hypothetical protein